MKSAISILSQSTWYGYEWLYGSSKSDKLDLSIDLVDINQMSLQYYKNPDMIVRFRFMKVSPVRKDGPLNFMKDWEGKNVDVACLIVFRKKSNGSWAMCDHGGKSIRCLMFKGRPFSFNEIESENPLSIDYLDIGHDASSDSAFVKNLVKIITSKRIILADLESYPPTVVSV